MKAKDRPGLFEQSLPLLILAALIAACLALSGCATGPATGTAPAAAVQEPMNANDAQAARALALQKVGESATDGETKRLAIMALVMMGQGNAPAPAAPVIVGNRSIGDAIFGFLDRTLERAISVAPAYLAYKGQIRSAETTERVAGINRDVSLNQSNNFLALGAAGINGTSATGIAGINGLAAVASRPGVPTTNISGNTGPVLVGGGNLNNGSLNPVNPAPVVCTVGTATVAGSCSR